MSCECKAVSREGLYIMVFLTMLAAGHASYQADRNSEKLDAIMKQMNIPPIVESAEKK